jgi:hypothetical protein
MKINWRIIKIWASILIVLYVGFTMGYKLYTHTLF